MASILARAIYEARDAVRLTQAQLGMRLGLRGSAVYRWERGSSVPSRRHRRALVTAIQAVNARAAAKLQAAFERHQGGPSPTDEPVSAAPPPAPAAPAGPLALELALFEMADELDVSPRRLRAAAVRLLARLAHAGFSIDSARRHMESSRARAPDAQATETAP